MPTFEEELIKDLERAVEKAQKNVNSLWRYFRTRVQQQEAINRLQEAKEALATAKGEQIPTSEQSALERRLPTHATKARIELEKDIRKAQDNVNSPKRYFRSEAEQQAAIKKLQEAQTRFNNIENPEATFASIRALQPEQGKEAITPGLNSHHAKQAKERAAQQAEKTSTPTLDKDQTKKNKGP